MVRSKSSKQWLREHFDDQYVQQSQADGYRSRASYKLQEIHQKDKLLFNGMTIVDLGSAPGSWSQVAVELAPTARIIASDILPMSGIVGVEFVQGDFTEQISYSNIMALLGDTKADLVLSDMAPNMSGVRDIDQPNAMYLAELAFEMAKDCLKPNGNFLVKVFQGEGIEPYQKALKSCFKSVKVRKPKSSRSRSREHYLLALGLKS